MRAALVLALIALVAAPAFAQGTLERHSPDRKAALDAIRTEIQSNALLRGSILFYDVRTRTAGVWVHVTADPHRPDGRPTRHCELGGDGEGDSQIDALLRREGSGWTVIDWGTCATDVWYVVWGFRYGLPASISIVGSMTYPYRASVWASDGLLSLRSEPSVSRGERLARIPSDTFVSVSGCQNEVVKIDGVYGRWCRTRYAGRVGWAFNGFMY